MTAAGPVYLREIAALLALGVTASDQTPLSAKLERQRLPGARVSTAWVPVVDSKPRVASKCAAARASTRVN